MKKIMRLSIVCLTLLISIFALNSCKKDGNTPTPGASLFDNSKMVDASFMGQIIDENGNPITGAEVKLGTHGYVVGDDGFFYFMDVSTPQNASLLKVTKAGYFDGFRTVHVIEGQDNQVRIMLMELPLAQTFAANAGGTVNIANGGSIVFEPNTIVNAATNTTHSGAVHVYAKWIDPTGDQLSVLMPGALRAVNGAGEEQALATYGMQAVELRDASGNELQLAQGSNASVRFPIPSALSSSAPTTIPLWSLNETNGMWQEEGEAQMVGSEYVGSVSHFSYWNCDVPSNVVTFEATFVDQNSNPISGGTCQLKIQNSTQVGSGITNSSGITTGPIPKNETFDLEFFAPGCALSSTPIYTQTFSTTTTNVNLGSITVSLANPTNVVGTAIDCNNNILANSPVTVDIPGGYLATVMTDANGAFDASIFCFTSSQSATVTAFDVSNLVQGSTAVIVNPLVINNIGNIAACGTLSEFINWSSTVGAVTTNVSVIEGVNAASFYQSFGGNRTFIGAGDSSATASSASISFGIDGPQNATGPHTLATYYDHLDGSTQMTVSGVPAVSIVSYQAIGGWIEGSFNATILGAFIPTRNVVCNFRVERTQ